MATGTSCRYLRPQTGIGGVRRGAGASARGGGGGAAAAASDWSPGGRTGGRGPGGRRRPHACGGRRAGSRGRQALCRARAEGEKCPLPSYDWFAL
eukprot:630205-Prorocentrum_minimum.AAC.1